MILVLLISLILIVLSLRFFLDRQVVGGFSWIISILLGLSMLGLFSSLFTLTGLPLWLLFLVTILGTGLYLFKNRLLLKRVSQEMSFGSGYSVPFLFLIIISMTYFIPSSPKYGGWDAFAIWNNHAKFLTSADKWQNMYNVALEWSHADYPILQPSIIAMFWKALGSNTFLVPVLFSFFVLFSIFATIYNVFMDKRYKLVALFSITVLAINAEFVGHVASQYADSLMGLFILLSLVLVYRNNVEVRNNFYLLGFIAALTMWIKNEGLIFFGILSLVLVLGNLSNIRNLISYFIGAFLPLAIGFLYKLFAPSNDLLSNPNEGFIEKIFDPSRYAIVYDYASGLITSSYILIPIAIVAVVLIRGKRVNRDQPFIIVMLMFLAYSGFFVVTPYDINWHLSTAMDRLIHQLFPSFILIATVAIYEHVKNKNAESKIE